MRLWLYLGALMAVAALLGATYRTGYSAGKARCEATHSAAALAQAEASRKLDEARRVAAVERDELRRQLEEQADATPVISDRCFGPDRVQRLNGIH